MLGREYKQSRADVWAMSPLEIDAYLRDWSEIQRAANQNPAKA